MTSWTLYNFGGYPKCLKWSSQSRISSTSPKRECVQPPNRFEPRFEPVLFGAFGPPTGSPYRFEPVNPVPHYDIPNAWLSIWKVALTFNKRKIILNKHIFCPTSTFKVCLEQTAEPKVTAMTVG